MSERILSWAGLPWIPIALFLGIIWHIRVGTSPRWLGLGLLCLTKVLIWAFWDRASSEIVKTIVLSAALGLFGLLVIALIPDANEDDSQDSSSTDAVSVQYCYVLKDPAGFWSEVGLGLAYSFILICLAAYAPTANSTLLAGLFWLSKERLTDAVLVILSAISVELMLVTIRGGQKGRLWGDIKQAISASSRRFAPRPIQ